jgi:hypothetical protein
VSVTHRIAELRLRVHASADSSAGIGESAERFARRALARAMDLIDARAPTRWIFVRHLPVRWKLSYSTFEDPNAFEQCARDLADTFVALPPTSNPAAEREVAVFESEAAWRAEHLMMHATGRPPPAWIFGALAHDDPISALCAPGHAVLARAVVDLLAAGRRLTRFVLALSTAQASALARALGLAVESSTADAPPVVAEAGTDVVRSLVASARRADVPRAGAVAALVLWGETRTLLGASASPEVRCRAVRAALRALNVADESSGERCSLDAAHASTPPAAEDMRDTRLISTRFAGLFYLLSIALELEVGEILWRACTPEREHLAAAARLLLGGIDADDPAPSLFGGALADRMPEASREQREEVSRELLAALIAAVPRWGLATLPELRLCLRATERGRMLIGTAGSGRHVLFATAAPNGRAAEAAVRELLRVWPISGCRVFAPRPLCEMFASRLTVDDRPSPKFGSGRAPAGDPASTIVSQIAGTLSHLFCARVGADGGAGGDAIIPYLSLPAEIELRPQLMTIRLPKESIDPAVRRAGLDRDPGWVPWLERTVRIEFAVPEF